MTKRKNQKRSNKKYRVNNRRLRANHQYKDTVFRMLYRDKENLLSLYNAMNDRNYTNPEELQIVTAQYVARVRKYAAEPDIALEEAVERAVEECMKEGILEEFLTRNKAEVIKMSIYEYDKEFEEKKLRKAEYEAGRKDGIEIGRKDGIQTGIKVGEENVLKRFIEKRIRKGMTLEEIAEDLDEDVMVIQKLINDNNEVK